MTSARRGLLATITAFGLATLPAQAEARLELTGLGASAQAASYEERYPDGQSLMRAPASILSVSVKALANAPWLRPFWPEPAAVYPSWRLQLNLSQATYAAQDANLPISIHARQAWLTELQALREADWKEIELSAGLGVIARWEQATHTAAPPTPSYAFSRNRWLLGPQLVGGFRWYFDDQLRQAVDFGRWRLIGTAALAPYVWSGIDPGLPSLPWLVGSRLELGVEHEWDHVRTGLTLRHWGLRGAGYEEAFFGPALHISWQPFSSYPRARH